MGRNVCLWTLILKLTLQAASGSRQTILIPWSQFFKTRKASKASLSALESKILTWSAPNTYLDQIEATAPLVSDPYAHERLRDSLEEVANDYDFCFIDIPPSLNWLCRSAFYASDYSLVCAIPEPFSVLAMQRLQKYHDAINKNHMIDVVGVLLSFWDERGSINDALIKGIDRAFEGKIFDARVRRDKAIPKSVLDGSPVFITEKSSRASEDYQKLSAEFLSRISSLEAAAGRREYVESK